MTMPAYKPGSAVEIFGSVDPNDAGRWIPAIYLRESNGLHRVSVGPAEYAVIDRNIRTEQPIPFWNAERPLLMRPELVVRTYRGLKDITRRPVKGELDDLLRAGATDSELRTRDVLERCPYGTPGDQLWIREPFRIADYVVATDNPDRIVAATVRYKADGFEHGYHGLDIAVQRRRARVWGLGWTPSIHMWRWASRLLLEIVTVELERLHWIEVDDIIREGFEVPAVDYTVPEDPRVLDQERASFARELIANAWDGIYKPPYAWGDNPLVWRIEYKIVEVRKP